MAKASMDKVLNTFSHKNIGTSETKQPTER